MLKQRVLTAVVLAAVFVGVLFLFPPVVFAFFVAAVMIVAAWEWANLCHLIRLPSRVAYVAVIAVTTLVLLALHELTYWVELEQILIFSCVWWAVALLLIQGYPSSVVLWRSVWVRMEMGGCVLIPALLSLIHLRNSPSGHWLIVAVVLLVAAADIGAYFAGRRFGRRKLATNVSPGKSWEGVAGGILAVSLLAAAFAVLRNQPLSLVLAIALPAALVSVVGDLLESMLKRFRGIKDSGNVLPGHGGVLDRIDGLVAAVPVFTLAMILANLQSW